MASTLPPSEVFALDGLVTPTAHGIASRVLARTAAGNITLFAFDAGEELSEHTAPFDALVVTLSGSLALTIGGRGMQTTTQSVVLMPANVPHAVQALEPSQHAVDHAARTAPGGWSFEDVSCVNDSDLWHTASTT